MELREIAQPEEYDRFVEANPSLHYMKTSMWGNFCQAQNHDQVHYLGFYENDVLRATAMVLQNTWHGHPYCYIPWGPSLDYADHAQIVEVFQLLKEYAVKQKVEFLRTDPNVLRCHHDINGNRLDDGFSNESVTKDLIDLGFRHKGYGYAYDGSWTNRYTLMVDLSPSMEIVQSRFSKPRLTSLNRHHVEGVFSRIGSRDDLSSLMEFEKQLSEQDGFKPHSRQFFISLLDCFKDHAVIYVTEIHLNQMIAGIEAELAGKKYAKDPEARQAKVKELSRARELIGAYGADLPIACGLFIRVGTGSWDLYTYNHKSFNFIKPVDNLHLFAMTDMKAHGVLHYDMCGFSGVTTKDDPEFGLYQYKRSFGPEFIERLGQFDDVLDEKRWQQFEKDRTLSWRIRHKANQLLYRRKHKKDVSE